MEQLLDQIQGLATADRGQVLAALGVGQAPAVPDDEASGSQAEGRHPSGRQPGQYNHGGPSGVFYRKLRLFGGKVPVPHGEVDYVTWRMQVHQIQDDDDEEVSDGALRRLILQSLQRPALDALRNSTGSASCMLQVLDTLYGSVEDGQELLVRFFTTYQEDKEIASAYLQRLYLKIMDVADKGGIVVAQVLSHLLRQFIRGSYDESIIQKLNLEEQVEDPPSFADILLSIRREETKRTEKRLRLKPGRVAAQVISPPKSPMPEHRVESKDSKLISELTSRLKELEAQMHQHNVVNSYRGHSGSQNNSSASSNNSGSSKPPDVRKRGPRRKLFCYRCGLDGHYAHLCKNKKNPELVQNKLLESEN